MPRVPTSLRILPEARDDLESIAGHNPDHAKRILGKIRDWEEHISWGRVPQDHLTYLTGSGSYNFYRERVGNAGYRIVYEISGDEMTVVAILPKSEETYDLEDFRRRVGRE